MLGAFALYHRSPRSPTPDEVSTIGVVPRTASRAIETARQRG